MPIDNYLLIEQEDDRIHEFGSGKRDELTLPGRERTPSLQQLVEVSTR